jgi:hypothetical protein
MACDTLAMRNSTASGTIRLLFLSGLLAATFAGCTAQYQPGVAQQAPESAQVNATLPEQADYEQEVLAAQQRQAQKVEVTVATRVFRLLRPDRRGLPHQRFLIQLDNGSTVLIAHDTKMAPPVPLKPGDFVRIHGEYIWNDKGGVIHWTHHDAQGRHEGGWIEFNGQRYQ